MTVPRIAYLLLTHSDPQQLRRLITRLQSDNVRFFVHVDKKSNLNDFHNVLGNERNVYFTKRRMRVYWRGYNMIKATVALLREAVNYDNDYYVLLSESDYPIKSNQYIFELLTSEPKEYISFFKLKDRPKWLDKIRHYHFWDSPLTNKRDGIKPFTRRYRKLQKKSTQILKERKYFSHLTPYGGSQWWALTDACAKYALNYLDTHKSFATFYQFTDVPDEMVFQTIILNSPFAKNVIYVDRYKEVIEEVRSTWREPALSSLFNLRFIDWDQKREFPAVLDERDFNSIRNSTCLFARKMDREKSATLMKRIDQELLQKR